MGGGDGGMWSINIVCDQQFALIPLSHWLPMYPLGHSHV